MQCIIWVWLTRLQYLRVKYPIKKPIMKSKCNKNLWDVWEQILIEDIDISQKWGRETINLNYLITVYILFYSNNNGKYYNERINTKVWGGLMQLCHIIFSIWTQDLDRWKKIEREKELNITTSVPNYRVFLEK